MSRLRRRHPGAEGRAGREDGAVLIEFALLFPVVMLVVLGIIQYGYQYWAMNQGSAIAREVARLAIVNTDWSCGTRWGTRQAALPAVGTTAPLITRSFASGGPGPTGVVPEGTGFTVTVTFDSLDLGLFPLPGNGRVSETATARVEYAPSLMSGGNTPQSCPSAYQ